MSESDLKGIYTHGFIYEFGIYGEMIIDLPNAKVYVEKCPAYMNRGRYKFIVAHKPECEHKFFVDFADMFPRYFFSLQRAFDEMADYVNFNAERIGITEIGITENIETKKQNLFPDIS